MKKILILLVVALCTASAAFSQTESQKNAPKMEKKHIGQHDGKKRYECPMKCVPATDKPGSVRSAKWILWR